MAPLRRYLRITKYSVLECRIYLEDPAVVNTWLLNPRDPVLPRVIESIRPLVLPKLREEKERERTRKKSAKKRSIKDVVAQDDFEVSVFLTETPTRHSLLFKHKHFRDKTQTKLTSNSSKLTGATRDAPVDIDALGNSAPAGPGGDEDDPVTILREESDDDVVVHLADVPMAESANEDAAASGDGGARRRSKRRRSSRGTGREHQQPVSSGGDSSDDQHLFVSDSDDDSAGHEADEAADATPESGDPPPSKRRRDKGPESEPEPGLDTEKETKEKLAMDISYEGFAIYGRVLCLVVKQRRSGGGGGGGGAGPSAARNRSGQARTTGGLLSSSVAGSRPHQQGSGRLHGGQGQAVMENWITSTQMPAMPDNEEEDAP